MRAGDLGTQVALQLQGEQLASIERGEITLDEGATMRHEAAKSLFAKIEFRWRTSDEAIIEQIRGASNRVFHHQFADAQVALDALYASVRVAQLNEFDVVKHDSAGRVLWQTDSTGKEIEDWSRLTGDDLEKCLLDVTRLKLALAPQLNELLLEAVFAKHIADDVYQDAYAKLVEETIPGRQSYASRVGRPDKYHAFFRYWLWSQCDVFVKELTNFCRILERIRYWRIESGPKAP